MHSRKKKLEELPKPTLVIMKLCFIKIKFHFKGFLRGVINISLRRNFRAFQQNSIVFFKLFVTSSKAFEMLSVHPHPPPIKINACLKNHTSILKHCLQCLVIPVWEKKKIILYIKKQCKYYLHLYLVNLQMKSLNICSSICIFILNRLLLFFNFNHSTQISFLSY